MTNDREKKPPTIEQVILAYRKCRDKVDELEAAHKLAIAPYREKMARFAVHMMAHMQQQGVQSIASKTAGTASMVQRVSVTVSDKDAFQEFLDQGGDSVAHLADVRAAKVAVQEYVGEVGEVPPGVSIKSMMDISFRKGRA